MKFTQAFHKDDARGVSQIIGITRDSIVGIRTVDYAEFAPAEAIKFASEIIRLSLEAIRAELFNGDPEGFLASPLSTLQGYQRYTELSETMEPKYAFTRASYEETERII